MYLVRSFTSVDREEHSFSKPTKNLEFSATMASCRGCSMVVCILVLVLMSGTTMARHVRPFHTEKKSFSPTQASEEMPTGSKVARGKLIHRDHPDSPFSPSSTTTFSERFSAAVKRSLERSDFIARRLVGTTPTDFQTPVISGNGEYLMEIDLGTPAQTFLSIADTGSDLVWVQCTPCTSCFNQSTPLFSSALSSSYVVAPCTDPLCLNLPSVTCDPNCAYVYTYGDNSSTAGDLSRETITVTDSTGVSTAIGNFAFGCSTDSQGSFNGADGIVGLGQGPLSLPSQISQFYENKFSYCLVTLGSAANVTSPLLFGSSADVNAVNLTYTSIMQNPLIPTYYYVPMIGITANGVDLGVPATAFELDVSGNGGAILDSGTTLTLLNPTAYSAVLQYVASTVKYPQVDGAQFGLDFCVSTAGVVNPDFPSMSFLFTAIDGVSTVDFPLTPSNVFVLADNLGTVCLAMAQSQSLSIIGNIQQSNHNIEFDNVNKVVGWTQVQC